MVPWSYCKAVETMITLGTLHAAQTLCACRYAMTSITVPEPVMSLAVAPKNRESSGAFSKPLNRFTKEDPTFKVGMDAESGQTIISGMGELHLDIYVERMKREYKVCTLHMVESHVRQSLLGVSLAQGRHSHQNGLPF